MESSNQVPDGGTIGRFRALLVQHGLQEILFTQVVELLQDKKLILKKGTIVDSTIVSAPSSTKNKEKKRDPDAHQTKKGNSWHFGYKAHIGVDKISRLVHHVEVTTANVHDLRQLCHAQIHGAQLHVRTSDRRNDTSAFPPDHGGKSYRRSTLQSDSGRLREERTYHARRNNCRRHDHRCAEFNENAEKERNPEMCQTKKGNE